MAAVNGNLKLIGLNTGKKYNVSIYAPDAVATLWTFNNSGAAAATSLAMYVFEEDVMIEDFSATAGPTATGVVFTKNGGVIPGGACLWANQLTSLPNRPSLGIKLQKGTMLGALQF